MKQAVVLIGLLIATLFTRTASAVPVFTDEEKGIVVNVGVLVQPTFQVTMPGSNGAGPGACNPAGGNDTRNRCSTGIGNALGDGPAYDLFLRRARLLVWGTATKDLAYFIGTDEPNLGKGGSSATVSPGSFIEDAFLSYTVHPAFKVDAGLMYVPLSHHTIEGATSLNALDYHSDLIKFPTGRFFRDVGVQFRGLAVMDHLHYRLGIFEGVRNGAMPALTAPAGGVAPLRTVVNPGSVPRFTAQIRGNVLGSEPDFFFKGIYFAEKPIISVGVGGDFQPGSNILPDGSHGNYLAGSGDVFVEYPLTKNDEVIFKGNYFVWAKGQSVAGTFATVAGATAATPGRIVAGGPVAYGAQAFYVEGGFRHAFIEPVAFVEVLKGNRETVSIVAPHVGANLWIMKHNFNVKTDFGYRRTERKAETTLKDIIWTTQGQLFF